jgi:hypothetical protein
MLKLFLLEYSICARLALMRYILYVLIKQSNTSYHVLFVSPTEVLSCGRRN